MRKRTAAWVLGAMLAVVVAVVVAGEESPAVEDHSIEVPASDGGGPVVLDARLYRPDRPDGERAPAVLLAHGLGGTKLGVADEATELARAGYLVLTWSARGFGASTGLSHLNSPDHEVGDAVHLIDWLAARPDVQLDAAGDPRMAIVGRSYGGALAFLVAARDPRVDAIVPITTWNDLARSLSPRAAPGAGGVLKAGWAAVLFEAARGEGDARCGRWSPDVCETYLRIAENGAIDPEAEEFLRRRSPASVLDQVAAPTLLIQGTLDSLFPLSEADANASGLETAGVPVGVTWFAGGHDGGDGTRTDQNRVSTTTRRWLDQHLGGSVPSEDVGFTFSRITGLDPVDRGRLATVYEVDGYPGMHGSRRLELPVHGPPQEVASLPQALTAAGSLGPERLAGAREGLSSGGRARWLADPVASAVTVLGSPRIRLRVASEHGSARLFVSMFDLAPDGFVTPIPSPSAALSLGGLGESLPAAEEMTVTLPGLVWELEPGHRLGIAVGTTDPLYGGSAATGVYQVEAVGAIELPLVEAVPLEDDLRLWTTLLAGLVAAVAATVGSVIIHARRAQRAGPDFGGQFAHLPLEVRGLSKSYGDLAAVSGVDIEVHHGQVVGLLGPNGAGKSTTLRVLMGLVAPSAGEVRVFGHHLRPGSPVLSRVGALVEGPGLLPHLSGGDNLRAYWKATGRPWGDAGYDDVVTIAGLGDAIDRKVATYSHGMRQRLAVAQAMLGLPEVLVLDEPTDGLDPPQIAAMRQVLRSYAAQGRAVLISSHLLAEVEQTCTHVVVMHKGAVVGAGPVSEVVGAGSTTVFEVTDVGRAVVTIEGLGLAHSVDGDGTLVVEVDGRSRAEVVAALVGAGVGVERVAPRRRLEDAFLAMVGASSTGGGDR